jgi:hypothetical protein
MFGKVRDWSVSHGLDGFKVRLFEVPRTARWLTTLVGYLDQATFCRLCGAKTPEFFWKIPLGRPVRDEDGWLVNSVASGMYSLFNKAVGYEWKREEVRLEFPVSDEVGKSLWGPDFNYWDDDEEDDDGRREGSATGADGGDDSSPDAGGSDAAGPAAGSDAGSAAG